MNREIMYTDEILGYTVAGLPIWPISGSEPDDDTDADPPEGDGEPDDTEDEAAEYTPPTREEWERVTRALEKANAEAKKRRLRDKAKKPDGEADEDAATKAREEAEAAFRPRLIKAEARAALVAAGAQSDRVAKLLRLIDTDAVELDEDGEVEGLEDQIEEIKADYPELFAPKHDAASHGRRVPRVNGASQERQRKELTPTQRQVAMLQGGR